MSGSPAASAPAVAIAHVSKSYGAVCVLDDVSLTVERGTAVAIVGESGAGKTTLLRMINRLVDPDVGRVRVHGADVRLGDPIALRRAIGYVPQEGGLLPHWRVRRNVALVPWLEHAADATRRADDVLARVGLDPARYGDRWPHELSGGQRQRAAVARALAGGQDLLLLDEAFGALDAIARAELQEMLLALRASATFTVVLVTHDLREAFRVADRMVVLRAGRVEQDAMVSAVRDAPATPYVAELLARAGERVA